MCFRAFRRDGAIVILIGDNGAVVVNVVGGNIRDKYFVGSVHDDEWDAVKKCICDGKRSRIYMMLDHSTQVYGRHAAPAMGKLLSRTEEEKSRPAGIVDDEGFNTSFLVSPMEGTGSRQSQCMLVESHIDDELYKNMLNLLKDNSSKEFEGVLLFSLELANIAMNVARKENKVKKWIVFLVYTKAGDFRQIVLHKGELFSSVTVKVSQSEREQPYMLAGRVYQGIQDTVKSIAASHGPLENGDVVSYMVVPGSVKSSLLSFDLKKEDVSVFTPYELGKVLKIQDHVSVSSVFCDTVIIYAMIQCSEFHHMMHTRGSLIVSRSRKMKLFAIFPTLVAIALLGLLCVINTVEILKTKNITSKLGEESIGLAEELRNIRNDQEFARINEMYDVVDLYRSLSSVSFDPMDVLVLLSKVERDNFKFTSFSWEAAEDFGVNIILGISVNPGKTVDWNKAFSHMLGNYKIVDVTTLNGKSEDLVMRIERKE